MADELRIFERPSLDRPVLITAFRGWNDGGQGASLAGGYLARAWDATRFAEIDPEEFFDFQATRPHVSLVEGLTRRIDWPENAFYYTPGAGHGPGCRAAARDRAEPALALVLGSRRRARERSRGRAGGDARLAARGRAAHAAVAGDRERERSAADRGARPAAVPLRGADGNRRHAPRRVPPRRHRVGLDLGGRAALRLARPQPARGARALRQARGAARARRSTRPSSRRQRTSTPSR